MKTTLLSFAILTLSLNAWADEVKFIGTNPVVPDKAQVEMISKSIIALVHDCTSATKISHKDIKSVNRGLEVGFANPIMFSALPAGKQDSIKKVVVRLWDNAEESYGMDIYAYNDREVYLLGKYVYMAYPIINMIIRPMPPNKSLKAGKPQSGTP